MDFKRIFAALIVAFAVVSGIYAACDDYWGPKDGKCRICGESDWNHKGYYDRNDSYNDPDLWYN